MPVLLAALQTEAATYKLLVGLKVKMEILVETLGAVDEARKLYSGRRRIS
jgi:hypothetical protein